MYTSKWTEIVVECESEYVDPVSQLLQKFAKNGIVIEETYDSVSDDEEFVKPKIIRVKAYIFVSKDNKDSIQYIDIGLTLFSHISSNIKFNYAVTDPEKWSSSWRKRYRPLKIGQRVVVVPSCVTSDSPKSTFSITVISISVDVKYTPSSFASIKTFDKIGIVFLLSTTE